MIEKTMWRGAGGTLDRVRLVALQTLGEALRMKVTLLLLLIGGCLVLAALRLQEFNFGAAELKFIGDFGLGALGGFGMLLSALATAQLFFNDLAGRTLYCVLTRQVRRWEYISGKFAGVAALLALYTLALGGILAGLLWWRAGRLGMADFSLSVVALACAIQWLKMTLVAAMTLLISSYAGTALFASCAGLLMTLVGHLRPLVREGRGLDWLRFWPNLSLFETETMLVSGQVLPAAALLNLTTYWFACVGLLVGLSAYAFQHREF